MLQYDVHQGEFNIHMLSPDQLQQEIRVISSQLTADVTLPITNIRKMYQLLKIKARITEDYFLFEITFPLISRDRYKLYKVIAVPHQIGSDMIQYTPSSEYVATDLKKDTYLELSTAELSTCFDREDEYMCDLKKSIYHLSSDQNFCEIDNRTETCKVTRLRCRNEWELLTNPAYILYHVCGNYTVKIICNDQVAIEWLVHAGSLYLEEGCLLKGLDFTMHVAKQSTNNLHISANVYAPNTDQLNYLVNTTMALDNISNVSDTREVVEALQNLHKRISEMKENQVELEETFSPHNIHHYVVNYSLVSVVVIATVALLWRCRRRRREQGASITKDIDLRSVARPNELISSASAVIVRKNNTLNNSPLPSIVKSVSVLKTV